MSPSEPHHTSPETTSPPDSQPTAEPQPEAVGLSSNEVPASPDVPPPLPPEATAAAAPAETSGKPKGGRREDQRVPALPALPPQPVPQVPPAPQPHDLSRIAQDLQIRKAQVEAVVQLLDEENTVPFITRYRKERTGGLNEEVIRRIQERVIHLRELASRKQTILKSIAGQGRLNEALTQALLAAESPKRLEDLYQPFKPKKKSLATEAREKGLGPLAEAIWTRDPTVANLAEVLPGLVDPDKWLLSPDEVLAGVKHILADMVADSADVRGPLRAYTWDTGLIVANRIETLPEGKGKEFEPYSNFKEPVKEIPPHRVLAINRGEKANVLRVRIETDAALANEIAQYHLGIADHPHRDLLAEVIKDALERLVLPGLEREVRRELTERAQDHAVHVFAKNLRSLLLQPPLRGKKVLAIDPGIRTGCKIAVLDETGKLVEDAVIYPHGQRRNTAEAKRKLEQLVRKHQVPVIAIGNGTGCRETEQLVAELIAELEQRRLNPTPAAPEAVTEAAPTPLAPEPISPSHEMPPQAPEAPQSSGESFLSAHVLTSDSLTIQSAVTVSTPAGESTTFMSASVESLTTTAPIAVASAPHSVSQTPTPPLHPPISLEGLPEAPVELAYVIVIEAGASDYSVSPIAREEFPDLDATTRGTISIGRRLQDPLAELVKIDPQHIGVGLYQHDVKQKHLKESLETVIGSSVNSVGVDLNTASVPLLRHVSGLNQLVAREVVNHRERNGRFASREQLLAVPGLGDKRYVQAAGFLKIADGAEPLDGTWIHPESYAAARQVLSDLGFSPADLRDRTKLEAFRSKLSPVNPTELALKLGVGEPTIRDILDALARPGRDPREDLPPPIFKKGVLKLEDITPGMELRGTVLNVVPFGAFVDIGLKESGLVHISQMANRYIRSPYDVVAVGDVVTVWVMEVKAGEKKISLSMIPPGQERRTGARAGGPPRGHSPEPVPQERQPGGDRPVHPPRGDRPAYQRGGPGGGGGRFGRGPGGGRGQPAPSRPGAAADPTAPVASSGPGQMPAPATPPKPRPPAKPRPLPNLTAEKKSGKAALNTFAELAAYFKKDEQAPSIPPAPAQEPKPAATPETESRSSSEPNQGPAPPPPSEPTKPEGEAPPQ
jgi:protein Tex